MADLDMKQLNEKVAELTTLLTKVHEDVKATPNDAIRKAEMEVLATEAAKKIAEKQYPKVEFGSGEGKAGFVEFLKMVKNGDQRIKAIASVNETTAADGGYVVPTEFIPQIIETALNSSLAAGLCTPITMKTWKANIQNQATDVSVTWIAEDGAFALQKPTLGQILLQIGKIGGVIPFTNEELDDMQVDLSSFYQKRVGLKIGQTIDNMIFEGSTGAGNLANGILNETGVNAVTLNGDNIDYDDFINLMFAVTVASYRVNAKFWLNESGLKLALKLKDNDGNPVFGNLVSGMPTTLLGKPFMTSDQISGLGTEASTTSIFFGDMANMWLLKHAKYGDSIAVDVSNSATSPAVGAAQQNAFLHDETWFRFKQRKGYKLVIPSSFSRLTLVK